MGNDHLHEVVSGKPFWYTALVLDAKVLVLNLAESLRFARQFLSGAVDMPESQMDTGHRGG